jgi:small RNA 2'-O-methyltransferase
MEEYSRPALHISPSPSCPEDIRTPTTMNNSVAADIEVHEVKFFPPLHEQRRSWALEILRRESITKVRTPRLRDRSWIPADAVLFLQVLDVGCGEGVFLQHLTHAPPWRPYTSETPAPSVFHKPDFIHARDLHGLDVLHSDLLYAADITAPDRHAYGWTRFEQLDISIWEGGLQVPNPVFKGIECIVATEVYVILHPQCSHWLIDCNV